VKKIRNALFRAGPKALNPVLTTTYDHKMSKVFPLVHLTLAYNMV